MVTLLLNQYIQRLYNSTSTGIIASAFVAATIQKHCCTIGRCLEFIASPSSSTKSSSVNFRVFTIVPDDILDLYFVRLQYDCDDTAIAMGTNKMVAVQLSRRQGLVLSCFCMPATSNHGIWFGRGPAMTIAPEYSSKSVE
jgi:hypothetical protein